MRVAYFLCALLTNTCKPNLCRFRRLESDKELPQVFSRVESVVDFSACAFEDNGDINDVNTGVKKLHIALK